MKKVIIIGCPGSGKSTFGRKLKDITGLPLYYLDMMYWNEDRTNVTKDIFLQRLQNAMSRSKWIIDGNYASTMEIRFSECDTVFFLDYEKEVCLDGVESRKGKVRPDMPWVESGDTDKEFLNFINNYNLESRHQVLDLMQKYSEKNIIVFHTREEAEEFLHKLKNIAEKGESINV